MTPIVPAKRLHETTRFRLIWQATTEFYPILPDTTIHKSIVAVYAN